MARSDSPKVAVCVLRVERRGDGVLITVTTTSDVQTNAPGRAKSVAGFAEALSLVSGFLEECEHDQADGGGAG